ncbi:MAG TPA: SMP-30/gluconolactonase/LRE family protein [Sphingobacterium sp.]|nr:SMP-30/gluconolactonase/LRE family protein [Sphingobacterium sp.]
MKYILLILTLQFAVVVEAQKKGELVEVADHFSFTEGPVADARGDIYFTDQPNNRIWKYSASGELIRFLEPSGRANGLAMDNDGWLVACADENNEIWRIHPETREIEVLVGTYAGKPLNGPNDLWISSSGNYYITDPYYQRSYWSRTSAELPEALYMYQQGKLLQVDSNFVRPNGIAASPDERKLYVADIGDNKTYVYDIAENGALHNKRFFCDRGSDGMTTDKKGNVYLTGDGVFVYTAQGALLRHIKVPVKWTANVCFGGKESEYLFITASEKIFKIYPDW